MAESKIAVLIETEVKRGKGVPADPIRIVKRYSDAYGNFVAENDPINVLDRVKAVVSACGSGQYDTHEAFSRILAIVESPNG